ncbi:MAG: pilus assembly protein PilM [Planctomycetales bacterium]|nr:pilus assembly protein PilM [Planctomycetales bacterium]
MISTELDFDPYVVWLQVQSSQRPLNAYEILGLEPFENNPTRLRVATTRKREMLAAKRPDADPETWQALNAELEAAIVTLQSSERKAVLDATLRRRGLGPTTAESSFIVAPPPTHNGENLVCRKCQKENPPQRRFCAGCGDSLWEKCPNCSAEHSANERFCGTCGAEVQGKHEEQAQALQAKLEQARALREAHRYERAISLLRSVAAIEDRRHAALAETALAETVRTEAAEKRQKDLAAIALNQGQELLARQSFEAAVQVLDSIPEPMRTREINECLERAKSQWKELLALSGEIRLLVEAKRTTELFPKIERLLALKPDHAQAQKLAAQLRDQLLAAAAKRLNEHLYADALKLLEQIPEFIQNEEVNTTIDKALELSVLLSELRLAPLATPATLALAQKLAKFAPTNAEAAKLVEELKARAVTRPEQSRFAAPVWIKPPQRTRLVLPVDWLGYFTRLTCEDAAAAKTLRESPGQFFVALGLALQGIEEADTAVNLMPAEKTSLLSKLPFSFGKKGPSAAWGLDLGESGLRAIKLNKDAKSGAIQLETCEFIPHAQPLAQIEKTLEREVVAMATLKDFLSRAKTEGARIVAGIASQRVLGRFFELPPMPGKKVAEAVQYEAKHQIPVPLEELTWAYHIQGQAPATVSKEPDERPRKILLVASRLSHAQAQAALFKAAGITVDELVPDCVALHNAFQYDFHTEQQKTAALLDVGFDATNFVVSGPRNLWFRSFGMGGETFTQALVKHFQLTREQAEELKLKPAKARRYSLYCATQDPLFVQFVSEVERSLASYSRYNSAQPVERLYGVGGAFQTHGLLRYLRWGK